MNKWLVIHSEDSFNERSDLIGFAASKTSIVKPKSKLVGEISKGDIVVYYAKSPLSSILGTFEVIGGPGSYYEKWTSGVIQFEIKAKVLIDHDPLPLRDLVPSLDLFTNKQNWGIRLNTSILKLSEKDYKVIESAINKWILPKWSDEARKSTIKFLKDKSFATMPDGVHFKHIDDYYGLMTLENFTNDKWVIHYKEDDKIDEYQSIRELVDDGWVLD